jgi:hypothetical protein
MLINTNTAAQARPSAMTSAFRAEAKDFSGFPAARRWPLSVVRLRIVLAL